MNDEQFQELAALVTELSVVVLDLARRLVQLEAAHQGLRDAVATRRG